MCDLVASAVTFALKKVFSMNIVFYHISINIVAFLNTLHMPVVHIQ